MSVLSYRVERAYCNDTIKDGPFAVAWLRIAGETRGEASSGPDSRRDVILNEVWGGDSDVFPRTVDTHIVHLRQKIEPDPENPRYVHNERGFGYRFEAV